MKTTKNLVAKFAAALLAGMMLFALTSCGKDKVAGNTYSNYGKYLHFNANGTIDEYDSTIPMDLLDEHKGEYWYTEVIGEKDGLPVRDGNIKIADKTFTKEIPSKIENAKWTQDKEAKKIVVQYMTEHYNLMERIFTYEDASLKLHQEDYGDWEIVKKK